MSRFVKAADKSQIPESGVMGIEVEGKSLVLVNLGGEIFALDDGCTAWLDQVRMGQTVPRWLAAEGASVKRSTSSG